MRKVFYVILLLVCILPCFSSCTKKYASEKALESVIVGKWMPTETAFADYLDFYWEFTSNNIINYYSLIKPSDVDFSDFQYCTYDNGTCYVPQGYRWELYHSEEYYIEGNYIYLGVIMIEVKDIVNTDKLDVKCPTINITGGLERVKQFATK